MEQVEKNHDIVLETVMQNYDIKNLVGNSKTIFPTMILVMIRTRRTTRKTYQRKMMVGLPLEMSIIRKQCMLVLMKGRLST